MAPGALNPGMKLVWRGLIVAALLGSATGGALGGAKALLPAQGAIAAGVRVAGAPLLPDASPRAAAEAAAAAVLSKQVSLRLGAETVVAASLGELGATIDVDDLARRIAGVGHEGGLTVRLDDVLEARRGRIDLAVRIELPVEELAARLERIKEERDAPPRSARLDVTAHTASGSSAGRYIDVYAAAEAIQRAMGSDKPIDLPLYDLAPRASTEVVAAIDTSQVLSKFETRFGYVGGQANRAKNITRAASQMEGVVLMPGEVVSFNTNVGPRSSDNGFFTAPEIYKGEMREGVGGGTCQVAGTLHAAAFLGGLDVIERSNHSRPSGYIRMGLDATVVYPIVDLKLRNPYPFPIVVHATIDKGTLTFELLGRDRPATVEWDADTVGVANFKRKIEEAPWLPPGKFVKKQKGIRGYSIRKTRKIHLKDGEERIEVTTDVYPPTFEIYQVPPGTDPAQELPPMPDSAQG